MRVAIVGTGISGLMCAHLLHREHDITVFEADERLGGHTNTVRVDLDDETHHIDTGFIVHNDRNYPNLVRLFGELGVATQPSEMSFSVADERTGIEYRGTNLNTVFAQRRNALRPSFLRMLAGIVRFNRAARGLIADGPGADVDSDESLAAFLDRQGFGRDVIERFIVPLGSSIWSADPASFLEFPAMSYARFMENHGLLELRYDVQWRTVTGGSKVYVDAISRPFADRIRLATPVQKLVRRVQEGTTEVVTPNGPETFDAVVLACHSDQALRMLADPSSAEREILGAIRYQPNVATLHTDEGMLPRTRRAWASWNYQLGSRDERSAALTYWMNTLQAIESRHEILVTLNRHDEIEADRVLGRFDYAHPVFDAGAMAAQRRRAEIQGVRGTYFAGAYWEYGFHEDGMRSALDVCRRLGVTW